MDAMRHPTPLLRIGPAAGGIGPPGRVPAASEARLGLRLSCRPPRPHLALSGRSRRGASPLTTPGYALFLCIRFGTSLIFRTCIECAARLAYRSA
jgi:hypothetical protein